MKKGQKTRRCPNMVPDIVWGGMKKCGGVIPAIPPVHPQYSECPRCARRETTILNVRQRLERQDRLRQAEQHITVPQDAEEAFIQQRRKYEKGL